MADRRDNEHRNLADVPEQGEVIEERRVTTRAWIGRFLGPILAILAYFTLPTGPDQLSPEGVAVISVGILMATWWITEALPLPATALLPIALFPLLGAVEVADATAPYADDVIFLFLGAFMVALSLQRWGLHRRVALLTVLAVGTNPLQLIAGFMIATAFLSMWMSNTATSLVMLPVGLSVLALVFRDGASSSREGTAEEEEGGSRREREEGIVEQVMARGGSNFATGLMLAIAYAASIGSLATLIGTPPNLIMAGFLSDNYDINIGFGQWMLIGLPLSVVFLVLAWVVLTRFVYPPEISEIVGGREMIRGQLEEMGPMSRGEKVVLVVFVLMALAWVAREPLSGWEALTSAVPLIADDGADAGIAIIAAIALFAIPVDWRNGVFALDWRTALSLPWGIILLFGGGLSLASAVTETGVDEWIGELVAGLEAVPTLVLVLTVIVSIILLTELTSNTGTTATFLPVLGGVAVGLNLDPLLLVVPATLAATCAFMMPVATPPNAVVFGSGYVTIAQMVRAGVWLNILAILLVSLTVYTLGALVLGISFG
jgi:solute carrier family 13 (sodium-dependent dicarboxylate transporter), member 2/3/5